MKAVRFSQFGGPEVLEIVNFPDPHPGPGQVRIAVRAAGVGLSDWKKRKGLIGCAACLTSGMLPAAMPLGIDADILVVRRDGQEGVVTYKDPRYSWELTREAIGLFASQKAYEVKRVFFADTALTLPPNVAGPDSGGPHENHFHVQFLPLPPPKKKPR